MRRNIMLRYQLQWRATTFILMYSVHEYEYFSLSKSYYFILHYSLRNSTLLRAENTKAQHSANLARKNCSSHYCIQYHESFMKPDLDN